MGPRGVVALALVALLVVGGLLPPRDGATTTSSPVATGSSLPGGVPRSGESPRTGSAAALPTPNPAIPPTTDAVAVPHGVVARGLPSSTELRIGLTVGFSHPAEIASLLAQLEDPGSSRFRHFLTYNAFESRFAPDPGSVASAEAAFRAVGASSVTPPSPGSATVEATLSVAGVRALLGVDPVGFVSPSDGSGVYTAVGTVRLPASLVGKVVGVDGLSGSLGAALSGAPSRAGLLPSTTLKLLPRFVKDAASGSYWYLGSDFAQAYQATELWPGNATSVRNATFPDGIAIATLLVGAYNYTLSMPLPPYDPAVVSRYFTDTFAPGWPLPTVTGVQVNLSNTTPPLPGPFPVNDTSGMEIENSLDLEMAGSLAPGSSLYNFYFAGSLLVSADVASAANYLSQDLAAALSYPHYGANHLAVISCSFGLPDRNVSAWDQELLLAATMGVTVVAASGDQGNAPSAATGNPFGPDPLWPATSAFNESGVLSVGGSSVVLSGKSTGTYTGPPLAVSYDPFVQGPGTMSAWSDSSGGPGKYLGSEGGLSQVIPEPWWQFHSAAEPSIVAAAETQGVRALGRAGPDLAFPASNTIAYIAENASGDPVPGLLAGTSVSAPLLAGLLADIVAVESSSAGTFQPLGYLAPEIYRLASYYAAFPTLSSPFLDVYNGSNDLFSAGPGWDAVTGWGGFFAPLLLTADEDPIARNYSYTGPTPELPPAPAPPFPLWVVVLVLAGAGTAASVGVAILLDARARESRTPAEPDIFAAAVLPGGGELPPPPSATFACPFCGAERPAEAGPCPSCGAR